MTGFRPRLSLSLVAALVAVSALSACNTVRGVGKDVQAGGVAVEDTAHDVQKDMKK